MKGEREDPKNNKNKNNHQNPFSRKIPNKSEFFKKKDETLKKKVNNSPNKNSKHSEEDLNKAWSSLNPRKRVRSTGGRRGNIPLREGIELDEGFRAKSPALRINDFGRRRKVFDDNQSVEFKRTGEVLLNYF